MLAKPRHKQHAASECDPEKTSFQYQQEKNRNKRQVTVNGSFLRCDREINPATAFLLHKHATAAYIMYETKVKPTTVTGGAQVIHDLIDGGSTLT